MLDLTRIGEHGIQQEASSSALQRRLETRAGLDFEETSADIGPWTWPQVIMRRALTSFALTGHCDVEMACFGRKGLVRAAGLHAHDLRTQLPVPPRSTDPSRAMRLDDDAGGASLTSCWDCYGELMGTKDASASNSDNRSLMTGSLAVAEVLCWSFVSPWNSAKSAGEPQRRCLDTLTYF